MLPHDTPRGIHTPYAALALLALSVFPATATAQVDIESLRRETPQGISASLGTKLDMKTGNTDKFELSFNARLDWVRGSGTTMLVGDGGLGFLSGDEFASSGLIHLRRTQWLEDWIAVEGFGQLNYDRPLLLDFRALAGAGIRVRAAEGDWGTVGGGLSLMLEREEMDLPAGSEHPDETETLRNSTFLSLRLVRGDNLVVTSTAYVQPALSDLGDLRIIENLGLAVSVTDRLALTTTFDLRYDSGPPDGIEGLDTKLQSGVTLTF